MTTLEVTKQSEILQTYEARRRVDMEKMIKRRDNKVIRVDLTKAKESVMSRLAAIEDILGDEYDLDRLRELAQADREGRCVVLPVKLHDKLYYVDKEQVRETEVESIHNWISGRWKLSTHTDRQSTHWIGYEVDFDGIGKTVFLTREEAEAALRREQDG